jgi:uncharacterized membrane protein
MRSKIKLISQRTRGQTIADTITSIVGSWYFLIGQSLLIFSWIYFNTSTPYKWDPYPFIFLNLALSFQAAYTAPIIMMSQKRITERDNQRAEADFQVNILAEKEITTILEKLEKIHTDIKNNDKK